MNYRVPVLFIFKNKIAFIPVKFVPNEELLCLAQFCFSTMLLLVLLWIFDIIGLLLLLSMPFASHIINNSAEDTRRIVDPLLENFMQGFVRGWMNSLEKKFKNKIQEKPIKKVYGNVASGPIVECCAEILVMIFMLFGMIVMLIVVAGFFGTLIFGPLYVITALVFLILNALYYALVPGSILAVLWYLLPEQYTLSFSWIWVVGRILLLGFIINMLSNQISKSNRSL